MIYKCMQNYTHGYRHTYPNIGVFQLIPYIIYSAAETYLNNTYRYFFQEPYQAYTYNISPLQCHIVIG